MDIIILIKYFFIALCGFYVICKLQNLCPSKIQIFLTFIGSILSSLIYMFVKNLLPSLHIMALVIPFILASRIILRQPFKKTVPLGLTSIAVSYVLAIIGLFIFSSIAFLIRLFYKFDDFVWLNILLCSLVGIFQILLTFVIFKIKRFSRGIPDLDKFLDSDLSMFISISIILFMSFAEIKNSDNILIISIAFFIAFLGIILFFVWKIRFNKIYIKRQKDKEVKELECAIQILQQKNKDITTENEAMASVIHRDNKTISSFTNTLKNISIQTTDQVTKEQLIKFLEYLQNEHSERQLHLNIKNNDIIALPKTNIFSIDSILNFMKNKATEFCIDLELALNCDISDLTANIIRETDLVTLLADLLENSIIATKHCDNKKMEVQFTLTDNVYELKISDSGIPFEPVVLDNFGTKKITTHKHEGGSGIGLVTIYEIIKRANASLFVIQGVDTFTKTISIIFDNKSRLSITSNLSTID